MCEFLPLMESDLCVHLQPRFFEELQNKKLCSTTFAITRRSRTTTLRVTCRSLATNLHQETFTYVSHKNSLVTSENWIFSPNLSFPLSLHCGHSLSLWVSSWLSIIPVSSFLDHYQYRYLPWFDIALVRRICKSEPIFTCEVMWASASENTKSIKVKGILVTHVNHS